MFQALTLMFALLVAPPLFAADSELCEGALSGNSAAFKEVLEALHLMGLKQLTSVIDSGKYPVEFRAKVFPLQTDVAARSSLLNNKKLIIRNLDLSSEQSRQISTWKVALALYELQVENRLFSADAFVGPLIWRDQRLRLVTTLEVELYKLFENSPWLNEERLLPKKDPGRFSWLRIAFGSDATQYIAPNQVDFQLWKKGGERAVTGALEGRHSRTMLFHYFNNHLKRLTRVMLVAHLISITPPLIQELPGYFEALETSQGYNEEIRHEAVRLEREILRQEKMPQPDSALIDSLKTELQRLVDRYPWLAYTTNRPGLR